MPVIKACVAAACLAAVGLAAFGCNNGGDSTTTPSPQTVSETFTGTVAVQGSDFHNFTVSAAGEVDITITAAGPPSTIFVSLAVGTPSGTTCTPIPTATINTQAGAVPQLSGTANPGTLCVIVSDVGNFTAPITYSVTVVHP